MKIKNEKKMKRKKYYQEHERLERVSCTVRG
jgi:hypothetical protein